MVKIDSLFYTKTPKRPYPLGAAHNYIAHIREYPPPPNPVYKEELIYILLLQNILHLTNHIPFDASLSFYSVFFLKTQILLASDIPRTDALKNIMTRQTETNPFIITYNATLPNLTSKIQKHSNILYSADRCKNVFKTPPLVAYRCCKNISDILIRPQITNLKTNFNNNSSGSFRCNSNSCIT